MKDEGSDRSEQQSAHADGSGGKSEELDEDGSKTKLCRHHGGSPPVVDDVACAREGLGHANIRPVIANVHGGERKTDECTDENGQRAERRLQINLAAVYHSAPERM